MMSGAIRNLAEMQKLSDEVLAHRKQVQSIHHTALSILLKKLEFFL